MSTRAVLVAFVAAVALHLLLGAGLSRLTHGKPVVLASPTSAPAKSATVTTTPPSAATAPAATAPTPAQPSHAVKTAVRSRLVKPARRRPPAPLPVFDLDGTQVAPPR